MLDIRELEAQIDFIRSLDTAVVSFNTFRRHVAQLLRGLSISTITLAPRYQLFRARICTSQPTHLEEIQYPSSLNAQARRASLPGCPMFYASSTREAPLFELKPEVGDRLALSSWVTNSLMLLNNVGFTRGVLRASKLNRESPLWSVDGPLSRAGQAERLVLRYLAEAFTEDDRAGSHPYFASSAVAHLLLSGPAIHGLVYPTLAMQSDADNYAIKPLIIDQHVRVRWIQWIRITSASSLGFQFEIDDLATAIAPDGTIAWQGGFLKPLRDAIHRHQQSRKEGGRLVVSADFSRSLFDSEGMLL